LHIAQYITLKSSGKFPGSGVTLVNNKKGEAGSGVTLVNNKKGEELFDPGSGVPRQRRHIFLSFIF
jgi:hypothetical protein